MKKLILFGGMCIIALSTFIVASCQKESATYTTEQKISKIEVDKLLFLKEMKNSVDQQTNATERGEDGCRWYIRVDSVYNADIWSIVGTGIGPVTGSDCSASQNIPFIGLDNDPCSNPQLTQQLGVWVPSNCCIPPQKTLGLATFGYSTKAGCSNIAEPDYYIKISLSIGNCWTSTGNESITTVEYKGQGTIVKKFSARNGCSGRIMERK